LPSRQIITCSIIFLAILISGFWLNNASNEQTNSHLLFVKWINDVNVSEGQSINSFASFYPREYVRILPKNDDFTEFSPTLP